MEDKIFKYLNSEMSETEEAEFRQQMADDAGLREQVENISLLKASFRASDIEQTIERRKRIRKRVAMWCGIAASVVLFTGCSLYVDALKYNENKAELCLQNYKPSTTEIELLRGSDKVSNALELYSNGDAGAALKLLDEFIENPGLHNPSDAYFLKGAILLKENGFDPDVISCLEKSDNPQAKELLSSLKLTFLF